MPETDKKREERLRRAREKLAKLEAATRTRGRADRMDWRPKALIWLHPESDITDRRRVWFSKEIEEKEEKGKRKKGTRIVTIPYVVPDDPECDAFYLLRKALEADEEIDGEETVLVVGSGRSKVEYRKGDLLGWDDFTFKKRMLPQQDFVCVAILAEDKDGKRPSKLKCEIFSGAKTLGKEIRKEIEAEVDENGEERGNPFFSPYPFRIEYDESASGSDMYSARARPGVKSDDELEKLFDEDAPDLKDEITPSDGEAVYEMLKGYLVLDLDFPEPKDATFKAPKNGEQVEDPPETKDGEDLPDDDVERLKLAENEAAEKEAAEKEAAEKEAAEKEAAGKEGTAKKSTAKKSTAKKSTAKKETTRKRKVAVSDPEPKKDDVKVPEGYEDPGPKPDDPNVDWWPDRVRGEVYDLCPKCERPVHEDHIQCPHVDCGVHYAPVDGAF